MTPFEQMWESSRYNAWSGQVAEITDLAAVSVLCLAFVPSSWLRWPAYAAVTMMWAWVATQHAHLEIEEKWRIRYAYASEHRQSLTDEERLAVTVDGANRILGPFLCGGLLVMQRCVLVLSLIGSCRFVGKRILNQRQQNSVGTGSTS